jgi:23S rRNA pseudouridine955/2504/2580 synthase
LDIVFEDDDLLVLAKPAGLPSQPGSRHADSVQSRIAARYREAPFTPTIAHRLDKATSGLLLAGKTYRELARLQALFRGREVRKIYLAWVRGLFEPPPDRLLVDELAKSGRTRRERVRAGSGKEARARAEVLERRDEASLVRLELLTGRTHQLRVQFASRGHPIIGDRKYGQPPHNDRMLLHAWIIELPERRFRLDPGWPDPYAVRVPDDNGSSA